MLLFSYSFLWAYYFLQNLPEEFISWNRHGMSLPKSQGIRFALSSSMPQGLFGISIHMTVCADCHSSLRSEHLSLILYYLIWTKSFTSFLLYFSAVICCDVILPNHVDFFILISVRTPFWLRKPFFRNLPYCWFILLLMIIDV